MKFVIINFILEHQINFLKEILILKNSNKFLPSKRSTLIIFRERNAGEFQAKHFVISNTKQNYYL